MQAPFRHTVLYDSECPVCLGSVERLRRWDTRKLLAYLPNQDPSVSKRFPSLSPEALAGSLYLVSPEGEVQEGADAVEALLRRLPRVAWGAWVFHLPLARPLARMLYRWVARNRYRLTCRHHCGPD